jgi:geranyl-CoA carboxylase alpha subunit
MIMEKKTPFSTLLVANRGEIAVRVIRTAHAMGYRTVAVYSQADAGAAHVGLADQAVCLGGNAPADSYLRIDRIIQAAKDTGADAIHPGYGFLAENADLATACAEAGIVFVGPSAKAIRAMGDKAGAKALMQKAGVPCVPGYEGENQSVENLKKQASQIGFPLMIKATAGGGGRGMRLVLDEFEFEDQLSSAKSEARAAFGNDVVLLERAIINPRHVEIQIMADRYGNVIHLGERDCSVQRRHQKVIEESPSPAVDAELRERMGAASTAAALAIGYEGAGTFEYLLDENGNFYFMEMNTRLQVEHPVTEAITGLDLVELQLRVAAGEPLSLTQEDVQFSGHAIEVRLCAEDPAAGFMPQSGCMTTWQPASELRVDHGLRDGAKVPPFYDSMVAKLIAHGATRDDALRRLQSGLKQTRAFGVRTNQSFLIACLAHPVFATGQVTTGFIDDHKSELLPDQGLIDARGAMLLAALLRAGPSTGLTHGFPTPLRLFRNGAEYTPHVRAFRYGACHVALPDFPDMTVDVIAVDGPDRFFMLDGQRQSAVLGQGTNGPVLLWEGQVLDYEDLTFAPSVAAETGGDGKVRATMNGTVVSVDVALGDTVTAGQKVLVLEAMKMEHTHVSAVDGRISAVHVSSGAQVTAHSVVVEVEPV